MISMWIRLTISVSVKSREIKGRGTRPCSYLVLLHELLTGGEEEAETTSICYERLFAANLHFLLAFTYPVQCGMWDSSRNGVSEPEYKPIVYSPAQRSVLRIVGFPAS